MVKEELTQLRAVRSRTLAMLQDLSQEQLDNIPQPGQWSVGEQVDHLILAEQVLRRDMAILIELAKTGQTPYLYRSFAEFNARPAFIPEFVLSWLEAPLTVFTTVIPASVREYILRNVPFPAQAPDVMLPRRGRTKAELCEELGAMLHKTEALFAANPSLDYDNMRHQ